MESDSSPLCLASFAYVCNIHRIMCSSTVVNFLGFIVFHYVNETLLIHSRVHGDLGCLQFFTIMTKAVKKLPYTCPWVNICTHFSWAIGIMVL